MASKLDRVYTLFQENLALSQQDSLAEDASLPFLNSLTDILDDLDRVDENIFIKSAVNPHDSEIKDSIRKSQHCWIPSTHWIGGFLWHYIMTANKDNFLYDISHIEHDMIQYTQYNLSLIHISEPTRP